MKLPLAFLVSALLCASVASAQTIGVFSDALGTDCNLTIPFPGDAAIVYVVGTVDGDAADGIGSVSFRITGLPTGWIATVIASDPDASIVIGNVFADGIAIAYPRCITGRRVLLSLLLVPTSAVANVGLHVMPHAVYPGCGFESAGCDTPCANLCGCGSLFFPCYCVAEIPGVINGPPCGVATAPETWGRVRRLFRR